MLLAGIAAVAFSVGGDDEEPAAAPSTRFTVALPPPGVGVEVNPIWSQRAAAKEFQKQLDAQDATLLTSVLTAQGTALLAGDRTGFVGVADPAKPASVAWLSERFATLRAMGIARWTPSVAKVTKRTAVDWQADVQVEFCFVANCARPQQTTLHTRWKATGGAAKPALVEVWDSVTDGSLLPWSETALQARIGDRVVVAAPRSQAGRIPGVLAAAEAAARVADGYAAGERPGRYVLYLAGDTEWTRWATGAHDKYVEGYATEATESVVLRMSAVGAGELASLLRHEFAHVASLAGASALVSDADAWWLIEGLAEYAGHGPQPLTAYPRRTETAAFLRSGKWKGDLRVTAPGPASSRDDASARYGVAYLGVSCLMQRYGPAATNAFFQAVAVKGNSLTGAAEQALGQPWTTVNSTCAAQIRAA